MVKRITFDSDGDEIEEFGDGVNEENENLSEEDSNIEDNDEDDSKVEEVPSQPIRNYYDDSDDDDDAPEEVSMSSSKARMMDIYKTQKESTIAYIVDFVFNL